MKFSKSNHMTLESRKTVVLCAMGATLLIFNAKAHSDPPEHKGRVTLTLSSIKALTLSGSLDPAHDMDCRAEFGRLLTEKITTSYSVNTETLIMSASSKFQGRQYKLNALVAKGKYEFGVFRPSSNLPLYAVLFQVGGDFTSSSSKLILNLNKQSNCEIGST